MINFRDRQMLKYVAFANDQGKGLQRRYTLHRTIKVLAINNVHLLKARRGAKHDANKNQGDTKTGFWQSQDKGQNVLQLRIIVPTFPPNLLTQHPTRQERQRKG